MSGTVTDLAEYRERRALRRGEITFEKLMSDKALPEEPLSFEGCCIRCWACGVRAFKAEEVSAEEWILGIVDCVHCHHPEHRFYVGLV